MWFAFIAKAKDKKTCKKEMCQNAETSNDFVKSRTNSRNSIQPHTALFLVECRNA